MTSTAPDEQSSLLNIDQQIEVWDANLHQAQELYEKNADDSNPYEFKYQSRSILLEVLKSVEEVSDNESDETTLSKVQSFLGRVYYLLGVNLYMTEEASRAEKSLIYAIYLLSKKSDSSDDLFKVVAAQPQTKEVEVEQEKTVGADDQVVEDSKEESIEEIDGGDKSVVDQESKSTSDEEKRDEVQEEEQEESASTNKLESTNTMLRIDKFNVKIEQLITVIGEEVVDLHYIPYLADSYNYAAMIWYNRSEYQKAELLFKRSESIYHYFKEHKEGLIRILHRMEDIHTLTTFYLAQVYGVTKNSLMSARYCFLTLKRQFKSGLEFNTREWATNSLTLGAFFISHNDFKQSEHFIKAAKYMVELEELEKNPTDEDFMQCKANVALSEAKFHFEKLKYSRQYLADKFSESASIIDNILGDLDEETAKNPIPAVPDMDLPELVFDNLPFEKVERSEHYVLKNFAEALPVFKASKASFEEALKFYVLDGYVTEHIQTIQQMSQLYRLLVFFEPDVERKIAMHQRRSSLLEGIIDELNENVYLGTLKQISFELGEIHVEIWDLLSKKVLLTQKAAPVKRMNGSCVDAIKFLNRFLGYFNKDRRKGGYKSQSDYTNIDSVSVEEENRPAFIRAHLNLGRMYYNLQSQDQKQMAEYAIAALREYTYCSKFDEKMAVPGVEEEILMCRQMMEMLPMKISELRRSST